MSFKVKCIEKNDTNYKENATFEEAVRTTGFGKFNFLLLLIALPASWAHVFETTTMSYVFPVAQCDLDLTLNNKGFLNAITFLGMISSGFAWGFLCDTLGRKKLLIYGYLVDSFLVLASSFSQNFTMLVISKYLGGFIINGPFSALTSYLAEFHSSQYRTRVQLVRGTLVTCGSLMLPVLAWAILPQNVRLWVFDNFVFHSWNIYLLFCCVPSLISGIVFGFMPESPKFLMTIGQNDKALAVFQRVYSLNTGKPKDTFPIKTLIDETKLNQDNKHGGHITVNRTKAKALSEGFQQIKPIFFKPYLQYVCLTCCISFTTQLGSDSMRLWMPQIYQAIIDYQFYNNGTTTNLCSMLEIITPSSFLKNSTLPENCVVNLAPEVYTNTMINTGSQVFFFLIVGSFINKLGKKIVVCSLSVFGGSFIMFLYLASSTVSTIALMTLFLSCGTICGTVIIAAVIDLFPTSLRTVALSLTLIFGRLGALIGNMVFPVLLSTIGCAPTFFVIGGIVISCAILTIFLPNTDKKSLI